MPKKVKAKIVKVPAGFRPTIYLNGRWRSFGTPYSPRDEEFKPHLSRVKAIKTSNSIAAVLGFTLEWED